MYEYICQHALVAKGKRRETHYFDWRFNKQLAIPIKGLREEDILNNPNMSVEDIPENKAHLEYYLNFFHVEQLKKHTSLITGLYYIYIYS